MAAQQSASVNGLKRGLHSTGLLLLMGVFPWGRQLVLATVTCGRTEPDTQERDRTEQGGHQGAPWAFIGLTLCSFIMFLVLSFLSSLSFLVSPFSFVSSYFL